MKNTVWGYERGTLLGNAESFVNRCGDGAYSEYMLRVSDTNMYESYKTEQWILVKTMSLYLTMVAK